MKNSIVLLILCTILIQVSCSNTTASSTTTEPGTNMASTPSKQSDKWTVITSSNQCGIEEKKQVVVKTQAEFDNLWAKCFQNMPPPVNKPNIDFSKDWVIGVFLGTMNSGGHSVTIDDITSSDSGTTVSLTHAAPGKNCAATMAIEFPYIIASIPHFSTQKTDFNITEKIVDCKE